METTIPKTSTLHSQKEDLVKAIKNLVKKGASQTGKFHFFFLILAVQVLVSPQKSAFGQKHPGQRAASTWISKEFSSAERESKVLRQTGYSIRKAYDSVSWEAVLMCLEAMGFPSIFLNWIRECVTSTSFLVLINGSPSNFFKGRS